MPPRPGTIWPRRCRPRQRALGDRAADVARLVARADDRDVRARARRAARARAVPRRRADAVGQLAAAARCRSEVSTSRGRGRSVRQISTDGRGRARRSGSSAGSPSARGRSSGAGRVPVSGPIDSTRGLRRRRVEHDAARHDDRAALAAQDDPGAVGRRRARGGRSSSRPSHAARTSSRGSTARPLTSSRTTSPSLVDDRTSTWSARLSGNEIARGRSARRGWARGPGRRRRTLRCAAGWTSARWATKNAANVASTRAANSPWARRVTGG